MEPGEIPRLHLEPTVEDALAQGLSRLRERDTWKLWRWPASERVFYTPDEYKCASCFKPFSLHCNFVPQHTLSHCPLNPWSCPEWAYLHCCLQPKAAHL